MDFTLCPIWPFLRVELVCFYLCNDSKTPKFIQYSGISDTENLYNIVEYKQGQVKKIWQFDFLINKYKYTL
jgi:hypothetical protein